MPLAALRACSCGALVKGRCTACAARRDRGRGTATARGYNAAWQRFRLVFISLLVSADVLPICGAALPEGPQTNDSGCRAAGVWSYTSADGSELHVDHEPPLTEAERRDVAAVCDARRVQLLCATCHAVKTAREGGVPYRTLPAAPVAAAGGA